MSWVEVIQQFSILLVIWVAIYGIDAWRREHLGKRQLELAEDTLALFYEAADAIRHIRHPVSLGGETDHVERGKTESDAQFQARKQASVVFHRYNHYQELFNKIHASRYRFMAQVGKGKSKPFDDLREIINEIVVSSRVLSRLWARDYFRTDKQWQEHLARIEKHEAIFWEGGDDDPINPKVEKLYVISRILANLLFQVKVHCTVS